MIFENIKNIDSAKIIEKIKPLAVAAICLAAVFAAGFGVGKSSYDNTGTQAQKRSLNYTTQNKDGQNAQGKTNTDTPGKTNDNSNTTAAAPTKTIVDPNNCYIKGSKSKTYHVPSGLFYARTTPVACFNSEDEAQAAGYKKSSR